MMIKSITLHAFGKFHDRTMDFDEGVNVIYGLNEQGKSTLHQFIEAMFYGFYKPHTKNRKYEEGYEVYNPWNHEGYGGTLTLEDDGQLIRLERQFTKGKDRLTIFDVASGEDITESYDYNKIIRQADPGSRHFGHNKITYQNTVSITQMASKTDDAMVAEIKDNMSNLASAHETNISVERVIEKIEKMEDAVGSNRKRTSAYYKLNQTLKDLQEALAEAREIHRQVSAEKQREEALKADGKALEKSMEDMRAALEQIEATEAREVLTKLKGLEAEGEQITADQKAHEAFKAFDMKAAQDLRALKERQQNCEKVLKEQEDEAAALKAQKEQLQSEGLSRPDIQGLENQYRALNESMEQLRQSHQQASAVEGDMGRLQVQKDLLMSVSHPGSHTGRLMGIALVGVAVSGLNLMLDLPVSLLAIYLVATVFGVVYTIRKQTAKKMAYEDYLGQREGFEREEERLSGKLDALKKERQDRLKLFGLEEEAALGALRDKVLAEKSLAQSKVAAYESRQVQCRQIEEKLGMLALNLDKSRSKAEAARQSLEEALAAHHLKSLEDMGEATNHYLAYKEGEEKLKHLTQRQQDLLGDRTREDLARKAATEAGEMTEEDAEAIKAALQEAQERYMVITSDIAAAVTKQATLESNHPTVAEIEESIKDKERLKAEYDRELQVLALMKATISDIARNIQNNFAPVLNVAMSRVVSEITEGRYRDIKVNPAMALTIYDSHNNRTVPAKSLSAGTIDTLYFGLRLGISEVLTEGRKLPLILDDPFVQYDDKRVEQVMKLLANQGRQVLLFTCHQREMASLKGLGVKFSSVMLGK